MSCARPCRLNTMGAKKGPAAKGSSAKMTPAQEKKAARKAEIAALKVRRPRPPLVPVRVDCGRRRLTSARAGGRRNLTSLRTREPSTRYRNSLRSSPPRSNPHQDCCACDPIPPDTLSPRAYPAGAHTVCGALLALPNSWALIPLGHPPSAVVQVLRGRPGPVPPAP